MQIGLSGRNSPLARLPVEVGRKNGTGSVAVGKPGRTAPDRERKIRNVEIWRARAGANGQPTHPARKHVEPANA